MSKEHQESSAWSERDERGRSGAEITRDQNMLNRTGNFKDFTVDEMRNFGRVLSNGIA